jgi:hypothetical protein
MRKAVAFEEVHRRFSTQSKELARRTPSAQDASIRRNFDRWRCTVQSSTTFPHSRSNAASFTTSDEKELPIGTPLNHGGDSERERRALIKQVPLA